MTTYSDPRVSAPSIGSTVALLLWREARPVVQVIFVLRLFIGATLAVGLSEIVADFDRLVIAAIGWSLLTMGVYITNGITDLVADRENASQRPLAAGLLSTSQATTAVVIMTMFGFLVLTSISLWIASIGLGFAILGWLYSCGKRPWKNHWFSAAICCAGGGFLTFLAGPLALEATPTPGSIIVMVAAAALMGIAGACKDLPDVQGDAVMGRRTLPVVLGAARSRIVISTTALLTQLSALIVGVATAGTDLAPLITMCTGTALLTLALLRQHTSPAQPYRIFMITQYFTAAAAL